VREGESPRECALRETREEIGVDVKLNRLIYAAPAGSWFIYNYLATYHADDFVLDRNEIDEIVEIAPAQLLPLVEKSPGIFAPFVRDALLHAANSGILPGLHRSLPPEIAVDRFALSR
jgi:8-oxo-dGTP pyrophosphatase MutT (NUDIX family)